MYDNEVQNVNKISDNPKANDDEAQKALHIRSESKTSGVFEKAKDIKSSNITMNAEEDL